MTSPYLQVHNEGQETARFDDLQESSLADV